ncbi:MAG: PSD1 and planctomycete cytochrome C domain-containing protein [Pirellulales bacterium]
MIRRFAAAHSWIAAFAIGLLAGAATIRAQESIAPLAAAADDAWFLAHVQPILQRRCYGCHSHDAGKMQGGLALDSRSGWTEGGDSGPAVVPRDADKSLLLQAVRRDGIEMPPDERLPDDEVATLVEWVRRGAPDPRVLAASASPRLADDDWWSLRPLQRRSLPAVARRDLPLGPVDMFLLEQLERQQLTYSPLASRRALLRRAAYDLHGLPPSLDELDEFERDEDPSAYERAVDRLLASPRLGERWARHWLDTIHFAETHGYEHDVYRGNAWPYRDYVIESFNRDKPWTRFVHEQMAADALYPDEPELTPALGFLGAGTFDQSTFSTAPVTFDYLDRDDMVTQVMAALASSTANCARCHDHKFDPISQEDYYSLQAVFAGIWKGDLPYDRDPQVFFQRQHWQNWLAAAERRDVDQLSLPEARDIAARWERENAGAAASWTPLELVVFTAAEGSQLRRTAAGPIAAEGPRPEKETYTIVARVGAEPLTALRLDVLSDPSLPMKGPGRQENGNLHLNEIELSATVGGGAPQPLKIRRATADWDQTGWTIQHAIDGNPATAWGIYPRVGESHFAVFELETPLAAASDATLTVVLKQTHGAGHLIGRFQLSATSAPGATAEAVPADVASALRVDSAARTAEQQATIASHAVKLVAQRELSQLPAPQRVYAAGAAVLRDNNVARIAEPKVVHLLKRGDIHKPGAVVRPGAFAALPAVPGRFDLADPKSESSRRVALATWFTHPRNPLTWRSIVNRVWHYHFGRGLCDTPNDFGRMGGEPTHPELLDRLALDFRDGDQSLKRLHRELLTSRAYRQTSNVTEGAGPSLEADGDNRWLGRMPRQRLDAESYRDAVLVASGRLDLSLGGRSIEHFKTSPGQQLTPKLDYEAYDWEGPGAGRRAIYAFIWRGISDPFMEALDFPDLALLQPVRGHSTSALQALAVYNNQFVLRHSEHFARRAAEAADATEGRVRFAARQVWLRDATDDEAHRLAEYADRHGLAALCRVLLNSSEFLFVE